jgi:large subunit ribosomal protein L19
MSDLLKAVEAPENTNVPDLHSGDTVKVFLRIKEGANERVQEFRGTVIRKRSGANGGNFTVRRVASNGIGVERTFMLRSPRIEKVVVERHATIRRAQVYFVGDRRGKSARLKQRFN